MVRSLNDLSELRESGFGQPRPRHGLNLLWWFAHNCVQIDAIGRMTTRFDPTNGAFGFHKFNNGGGLLPNTNMPYYEVGNLSTPGSLPHYVTENYTRWSYKSNTDRIIVSFYSGMNMFYSIYVTQHSDQTNFDQNHTYRISSDLLKEIQELNRVNFLSKVMNDPKPNVFDCSAEMICKLICALLVLFAFSFFLLK